MYKKCLFFICAAFFLEVKSDCDGYFDCFNSFFNNFFVNSETNVEYINATSKNLPENFVEVKDVKISDLDKVLSDISSFVQQDLKDQLKTQSDSALFKNVNPNTKVYVKTFSYNSPANILPSFENLGFIEDTIQENDTEKTITDDRVFSLSPQTTTQSARKIIENQKDVSENEISKTDDLSYYDSLEDNSTDYPIIDYIDLYKDTTNEENIYEPEVTTSVNIRDEIQETLVEYVEGMEKFIWDINNSTDPAEKGEDFTGLLPWISTIFLKNETKTNQYEYFCDGALLNEMLVITAARCVNFGNKTVEAENLLVILGKKSLLSMADGEKMLKIKRIITHNNFKAEDGRIQNDLALLVLENSAKFNEVVQPASFGEDIEGVDKSFTTAWNLQGDIIPVSLEESDLQACIRNNVGENMFCAAFGQDVALCPSYGGVFAGSVNNTWSLYGIRSGDTSERGPCFEKNVLFTNLLPYRKWIEKNSMEVFKESGNSTTSEK